MKKEKTEQEKPRLCPNCGHEAGLNFCPRCGQRTSERLVSMRHIIDDFVDDYLSVDSKLAKSIVLLFRPGFLTNEYIKGRRTAYIKPFRLFLLVTLIYFVCLSFFPADIKLVKINEDDGTEAEAAAEAIRDIPALKGLDSVPQEFSRELKQEFEFMEEEVADAGEQENLLELTGWVGRNFTDKWKTIDEFNRDISSTFLRNIPKIVLVLLPIFAFILKIIYIRRKRYYAEHFVFTLHVHSLAFMLFFLELPFKALWGKESEPAETAAVISVLILLGYLFIAMRKVYKQSRVKTAVKMTFLLTTYLVMMGVTILCALGVIFLSKVLF